MPKEPRIVAELGRPETPDETAARRAENSRKHRANQTATNLLLALVASLAVVLVIYFGVVRPEQPPADPVDWGVVAAQAQSETPVPLAVPTLPQEWSANDAALRTGPSKSLVWRIGFLAPKSGYIALDQGIGTPVGWVDDQIGALRAADSTTLRVVDGTSWQVYDRTTAPDPGNYAYSMSITVNDVVYLLHGSATDADFETLASAVVAELPEHTK